MIKTNLNKNNFKTRHHFGNYRYIKLYKLHKTMPSNSEAHNKVKYKVKYIFVKSI